MAAIGRIIAAGTLLILLFGCGRPYDWTGTWTGERNLPVNPGTDPALAKTLRRVRLEVKPNREFVLTEGGMPVAGQWSVSGDTLHLEPLTVAGRPIQGSYSPAKATRRPDGGLTLVNPFGIQTDPTVLRRESQPDASNVRNR